MMANKAGVICAMARFCNISIQKKILISMLAFTLIPILLVSAVAISITYKTMRDRLIYDHRMSSGWLQNRLAVENSDMMDRFYKGGHSSLVHSGWRIPPGDHLRTDTQTAAGNSGRSL